MEAIIEKDGQNNITATYTYGPGIDNIISMKRNSQSYYYIKDALGSVTAITNNSGNIVESYSYDAYGRPTIYNGNDVPISDSAIGNFYLFTGRRYAAVTQLYFYRARYYDPVIGRFISRDPLGISAGLNLYSYVEGNPVMLTDPTGEIVEICKRALLGWERRRGIIHHSYLKINGKSYGLYTQDKDAWYGPAEVVSPDPYPKIAGKVKDVECHVDRCVDEKCLIKWIVHYRAFPGYIITPKDCNYWVHRLIRACRTWGRSP